MCLNKLVLYHISHVSCSTIARQYSMESSGTHWQCDSLHHINNSYSLLSAHRTTVQHYMVLHDTVYRTLILHCTVLYCTVKTSLHQGLIAHHLLVVDKKYSHRIALHRMTMLI